MAAPMYGPFLGDDQDQARFGAEFSQQMQPWLQAAQTGAAANQADLTRLFGEAMNSLPKTNPVPPRALPPGPNPLLFGLAGAFANLNASQTGSGQQPALVGNLLMHQIANRDQVLEANQQDERAFQLQRLEHSENLHREFLKGMLDQSVESNNLEGAFQHSKALYTLEKTNQQRQEKLAEERKIAAEKREQADALERIRVTGSETRKTVSTKMENAAKLKAQVGAVKLPDAIKTVLTGKLADIRAAVSAMTIDQDTAAGMEAGAYQWALDQSKAVADTTGADTDSLRTFFKKRMSKK